MKRKKLLKQLSNYFDMDRRELCERRDKMKLLLKQLRQKERELKQRCKTEIDDDKLRRLKKHRATVHAQRVKGIKALKKMSCD
ncbi:MAG: hypothetical protein MI754_04250 [Chromatiales bacterium]|nr:hypothetical protein [Chromatiales bacterium]